MGTLFLEAEANGLSERDIDTSSLRSTKTLGQSEKTKHQGYHEERIWRAEGEKSGESSLDEYDSNETNGNSCQHTEPKNFDPSVVGAALRSGVSQAIPEYTAVRKSRKRQLKPGWRQRLEDARKALKYEESDISASSMSSSEDSEFSDWNGFSDGEFPDVVIGNKHEPMEPGNEANSTPGPYEADTSERYDSFNDGEENTHQKAREFKLWAREQSGFGPSLSNIASLPELPPRQLQPTLAVLEKQVDPPASSDNDTKRQRVPNNLKSLLTLGLLSTGTERIVNPGVTSFSTHHYGRAADNGDSQSARLSCHLRRNRFGKNYTNSTISIRSRVWIPWNRPAWNDRCDPTKASCRSEHVVSSCRRAWI